MKANKLTVKINRPISEVFDFTINPINTPRWFESITKEEFVGDRVQIGTRYINEDTDGNKSFYEVSDFKQNELFELTSLASPYSVRYTYTELSPSETELEYFEWMKEGDLENPCEQKALEVLKGLLEVQ